MPVKRHSIAHSEENARARTFEFFYHRRVSLRAGGVRFVLVTNFVPTSTLTKSEDSHFTYVFPCFLVETFRYFIPRVVSI